MSQERIVNLSFVAAALILWFVSASLFAQVLDFVGPDWDMHLIGREFRLSNMAGIAVGIAGGMYLWRNERIFELAHEVAGELRKVTWPTWPEVKLSTVVVMTVTVAVATCLWAFDTVLGAIIRQVYRI